MCVLIQFYHLFLWIGHHGISSSKDNSAFRYTVLVLDPLWGLRKLVLSGEPACQVKRNQSGGVGVLKAILNQKDFKAVVYLKY